MKAVFSCQPSAFNLVVLMKKLWASRVELITPPTETGDTKCFTNVFAWAENKEEFAEIVTRHLRTEGISVLEFEECSCVTDSSEFPEETRSFVEWVRDHPDEITTADRHYYPSRLV